MVSADTSSQTVRVGIVALYPCIDRSIDTAAGADGDRFIGVYGYEHGPEIPRTAISTIDVTALAAIPVGTAHCRDQW